MTAKDVVLEFPNTSEREIQGEAAGRVDRGTSVDPGATVRSVPRNTKQPGPHDNLRQRQRYVVERGGGSSGTAYNKLDHEVIDQERIASFRIVARATRSDARLICWALNKAIP